MIFHDLFTSINSKKAYHHLPRPLLGPRHFINRRVEVVATLTTWRWNISPLDSWLCLEKMGTQQFVFIIIIITIIIII
jgi:hypothetical protein